MRNISKLAVVILFSVTFSSSYAFAQIDCPIEGTSKPGGRALTPDKIQLNKYKNRTSVSNFYCTEDRRRHSGVAKGR